MSNQCPQDDAQNTLSGLIAKLNKYKNQGIDNEVTQQLEEEIQIMNNYIQDRRNGFSSV
jgi:hypothetical protein